MNYEEEFWKIVAEIDWPNKHAEIDTERWQVILLNRYSDEQLKELNNIYSNYRHELAEEARHYEERYGPFIYSDDGFEDLLAHIISCGKEEVEKCLMEPRLMADRAKRHDYRESFSYCIPYPDYREMYSYVCLLKHLKSIAEDYKSESDLDKEECAYHAERALNDIVYLKTLEEDHLMKLGREVGEYRLANMASMYKRLGDILPMG